MKFLMKIAFFGLIFSSCSNFFDQVINIDPPKYDKQLVIQCKADNFDSVLQISVTRNVGLLETVADSLLNVSDATVEWLENGVLMHTFTLDSMGFVSQVNYGQVFFKYYGANLRQPFITPGKNYELRVSHPDFPSVSAMQTAPIPLKLDTATVRIDSLGFGNQHASFSLTFQDPPNEVNIYEIYVRSNNLNYQYGIESDDPNIENSVFYDRVLLSDRNFDGKKYNFRFKTDDVYSDSYIVGFRSISKEYYQFIKSVPKNEEASYNPFASPVQVPSNITGGLGLFGLAGTHEIVVKP
jgi:hypothetical protein